MANFTYIIGDPESGDGAVVDPAWEVEGIIKKTEEMKLKIRFIINTHSHFDHIDGNSRLKEKSGAKIVIHKDEAKYLKHFSPPPADLEVAEGDTIELGKEGIRVIHTPGHSPGSICLFFENRLITGDTLFVGGIGRTDFPGGDPKTMFESLNKIMMLDKNIEIYPGHNYGATPKSTISREKENNPYLRFKSAEEFIRAS
ncbi:MAG: MBL fold metallo-hydrolase [Nitrospirae bacterium]|nr:MBL fold metallo-hydrolase [Nitrospirota bacterium]